MNLIIATSAPDFSVRWLTGWAAYDRCVFDVLDLSRQETIAGFIHIGTSSETIAEQEWPRLSDTVTEFWAFTISKRFFSTASTIG
jgi:nitroreductase